MGGSLGTDVTERLLLLATTALALDLLLLALPGGGMETRPLTMAPNKILDQQTNFNKH